MSDINHLTDRIAHLRDHKNKAGAPRTPLPGKRKVKRERRFAIDYFMLVAYSLLGTAILVQIFLIVWLDIV